MPHVQPGLFIHRADTDGVLLFAIVAAPEETFVALRCLGILHLVDADRAAFNTARAITPTLHFEEFDGGKLIRASGWNLFDDLGF